MDNHEQKSKHRAGDLKPFLAEQGQALATSIHLLSTALERRSQAVEQAQATIERLRLEAQQQIERKGMLEREIAELRQQAAALEQERDQWVQKASQPRRIHSLPVRQVNPLFLAKS